MGGSSKNGFGISNYLFCPNRTLIGCHSDKDNAIDKGTRHASPSSISLPLQFLLDQDKKNKILIWLARSYERFNQWNKFT